MTISRRHFLKSILFGVAAINGLGEPIESKKNEFYTLLPRQPFANQIKTGGRVNLPVNATIFKNYEDAVKVLRRDNYDKYKGSQRRSVFGVDVGIFNSTIHISSQELKRLDAQNSFSDICSKVYQNKDIGIDFTDFVPRDEVIDATSKILALPQDEGLIAAKTVICDQSYDTYVQFVRTNAAENVHMVRMFHQLRKIQDHFVDGQELLSVINFA